MRQKSRRINGKTSKSENTSTQKRPAKPGELQRYITIQPNETRGRKGGSTSHRNELLYDVQNSRPARMYGNQRERNKNHGTYVVQPVQRYTGQSKLQ